MKEAQAGQARQHLQPASHRRTAILSIHRTLYQILGLPALNMFDILASDLSDRS
jgi:hypothetical protein